MAEKPLDAERVAAFLDGRLLGAERDAVLAQIATSSEWREVCADAAGVMAELASPESERLERDKVNLEPTPATPTLALDIQSRRVGSSIRWGASRRSLLPLFLAAAALFALGISYRQWSGPNRLAPDAEALVLSVASAYSVALTLDTSRLTDRWPQVRAARSTLDGRSASVRIGALAVDLLFERGREGGQVREDLRNELLGYLRNVPGSSQPTAELRDATDPPAVHYALRNVRTLVDSTAFDAGAWIELARQMQMRNPHEPSRLSNAVDAARAFAANDETVGLLIAQLERGAAGETESLLIGPTLDTLLHRIAQ